MTSLDERAWEAYKVSYKLTEEELKNEGLSDALRNTLSFSSIRLSIAVKDLFTVFRKSLLNWK